MEVSDVVHESSAWMSGMCAVEVLNVQKQKKEAAGWTSAVGREMQKGADGPAYIAKGPGELN